jgi:5-methylcytosine-specific restriction endonuclease McrA
MPNWHAHPLRAERVALALARRAPFGAWDPSTSHRLPPLPFKTIEGRKKAGFGTLESFRGRCYVCGQHVYKGGRFRPSKPGEKPGRGNWHACCLAAYMLWTNHRSALNFIEPRCACCKTPGFNAAEFQADHKVPLYRVVRDYWAMPWYDRLAYWGLTNLQALCELCHKRKNKREARDRRGKQTRPVNYQFTMTPLLARARAA